MKIRLALLASLFLAVGVARAATDYAIQMTRKATVGEHYRVVASGSDEQSATAQVDGQEMPPRSEKLSVELVADCEVLALTPSGRETKTRMTIVKLVRLTASQPVDVLPAGTVVVAERIADKFTTAFTVGESRAAKDVAKALDTAGITLASDSEPNDEKIFGTTERKKVGDSWPIDATEAAAGFARQKIQADASNLSGTATLVEVIQQDNQPVLRIAAKLGMKGFKPPLPPGMEVQSAEFTSSHSGLFPVDPTQRLLQESSTLSTTVTASGTNNGRTLSMSVTKKTTCDKKFTRN